VPNPGPQTEFLSSDVYEILFGGAAGGGKSQALLIGAAMKLGQGYGKHFRGIILRRTYPELEDTLIPVSQRLYTSFGGKYNQGKHQWKFPAGEIIQFGHAQQAEDIKRYLGGEYQYVGFDELTTFLRSQYLALLERVRSAFGIPLEVRATTNPGQEGHEWVFKRWAPWLDPECPTKGTSGKVIYFRREGDGAEKVVERTAPMALGRTFIPSRLEDNPYLFNDGKYEAQLQQLDPVQREQKRRGDWLIKPAKGLYFNRKWVTFIDRADLPKDLNRVRYWDLAATEAEEGKDPDWTEGMLLGMTVDKATTYVIDNVGKQLDPGDAETLILSTAAADGPEVAIGMEQEPGASGKTVIASYARKLTGYRFHGYSKRHNKVVAFGPFSADCKNKKVIVVRGEWVDAWLLQLEQFPEGAKDDKCDATSGAHTVLSNLPKPRVTRTNVGSADRSASIEERPIGGY
jgi:predicted phage terminase large subunit-like protein